MKLPDPEARSSSPCSVRLNCTLRGRYAKYLIETAQLGITYRQVVQRLIDAALMLSIRQHAPEMDACLADAEAWLSEQLVLARDPDLRNGLTSTRSRIGKARQWARQLMAL